MARPKRIVCYAINGTGMGHITRLLGIARWIRRFVTFLDEQAPEILFLTSSDASDILAEARFAAFKIPSKTIANSAGLDKLEYRRLAKQFIWQTLGVFSPDLLVVDTFPSGSFDELFQVLDGPFKKGFVFRHVKPDYAQRATFRSAVQMYDSIVIPHRANGRAAAECLSMLPPKLNARCGGEVIQFEREQLIDRSQARRELGISNETPLVYVSAGGGGDRNVEQTLHGIIECLTANTHLQLLVGAGPLYRGARKSTSQIIWSESPGIHKYFRACDAAVSAGGYNTFHELLFAGIPTLFYPQNKIADDQWERVKDAESVGACLTLEDLSDTKTLSAKLHQLLVAQTALELKAKSDEYLKQNGAAKCAIELLRPLYPPNKLDWAFHVVESSIAAELESISNHNPMILSDWLPSIFPQSRIENLSKVSAMESVLAQLTPDSANELRKVLNNQSGLDQQDELIESLRYLLVSIRNDRQPEEAQNLADETIRVITATSKKYEQLIGTGRIPWTEWMRRIIDGIVKLFKTPMRIPIIERLRLLKTFPRIEDASNIEEVMELFTGYLELKLQNDLAEHEILRNIQLLKIANPNVCKSHFTLMTGVKP